MLFDIVSIYARQRNRVIDRWLYHGRSRFGDQLLQPRHESIRATVKAMKAGRPFYYLPDMDHGRKESIFVPFFGVQTATITGLPRFARMADAAVVPCVTRLLPGGAGYRLSFGEPWENFPSGDIEADVARMNAEIEALVRTMPEQYYWFTNGSRLVLTASPGFTERAPRRFARRRSTIGNAALPTSAIPDTRNTIPAPSSASSGCQWRPAPNISARPNSAAAAPHRAMLHASQGVPEGREAECSGAFDSVSVIRLSSQRACREDTAA